MIKKVSLLELKKSLDTIKTEFVNVEIDEKNNKIKFLPIKEEEIVDFDNEFNINEIVV